LLIFYLEMSRDFMGFGHEDMYKIGEKEKNSEYIQQFMKNEKIKLKKLKDMPAKNVGSAGFNKLAQQR